MDRPRLQEVVADYLRRLYPTRCSDACADERHTHCTYPTCDCQCHPIPDRKE